MHKLLNESSKLEILGDGSQVKCYLNVADGYWKRNIINNSSEVIYIKKPIVKFYLNGISSSKPSKRFLSNIIKNKKISIFRKFTFLIKYILPLKLFYLYYLSQKLKSLLIDLII